MEVDRYVLEAGTILRGGTVTVRYADRHTRLVTGVVEQIWQSAFHDYAVLLLRSAEGALLSTNTSCVERVHRQEEEEAHE